MSRASSSASTETSDDVISAGPIGESVAACARVEGRMTRTSTTLDWGPGMKLGTEAVSPRRCDGTSCQR